MRPADYVNEIALPALRQARDDRASRWKAYVACMTVFHVKDYLKSVGERAIESAMRTAGGNAFDVCRGICNGTKHQATDSTHPISFRAGDDWHRPPARAGQMRVGASRLGDTLGGREIQAGPGSADLYDCAKKTLQLFQAIYPKHLGGCDLSGL
jgi:hypothetical protein